jgi:hypothetical protein
MAPFGFAPTVSHGGLCGISPGFPGLSPTTGHVPTRSSPVRRWPEPKPRPARLACVKHAASVRSEPGSNSQVHRARPGRSPTAQMPFDQAPLTTLDAKRSFKPTPSQRPPLWDGTGARGRMRSLACFQKTDAAVKDRAPRTAPADEETAPRFHGAKNRCPKAQRSGLQPHGPQPPDTAAGSPEGVTDRPVRKEQPLRCGMPDLAPDSASFKAPLKLPRGDRLAADTGAGASRP